jgi:predicted permease
MPGFTLASVLVLGMGIGAVTLMFSALHAVVLRPLPFPEPERLVWAWLSSNEHPNNSISAADYFDYREQADTFESLAVFLVFRPPVVITGGDEAQRAVCNIVSASLFPTLGISPQLGRPLLREDEAPSSSDVVMLSHGFWQQRFGGKETILGNTLTVDGKPYVIAGVMPAGFDFPPDVDLWFPLRTDAGYARGRGNNNFFMLGRLRDSVSIQQAQAQIDSIAAGIAAAHPKDRKGWGVTLVPLHERYFGSLRSSLTVLMGLISLVPLVACANIASLFLARAADRTGEVAVRFALGGSRLRVVRQLLTESLCVGLAGGAVGLALTWWGTVVLRSLHSDTLPRLSTVGVDGTVLVFGLLTALVTVPLFGILPALRGTRFALTEALKGCAGNRIGGGKTGLRNILVVAQVALSVTLLVATGLLLGSYMRLQRVDVGLRAESLLTFELQLPAHKYTEQPHIQQAWEELHQRMLALPDVKSLGAIDQLPAQGGGTYNTVHAAHRPPVDPGDGVAAQRRFVSDGFFQAAGIPLVAGRTFQATDTLDGPRVVVVNQALAETAFPGEEPLNRVLILPWDPPVEMEVVGVVGNVKEFGPDTPSPPAFYMSSRQFSQADMRFLARTDGDPLRTVGALRHVVREIDADIPLSQVATMESRLEQFFAQPRFRTGLVGLFALVTLVLACIGVYGLLACVVRQREREISIRVAVGARAWDIFLLVVGHGMLLVGLGIGVGLLGGLVAAHVMRSFLYDISPADAVTFASMSLSLGLVALLACVGPAWRASRIDPCHALKAD